MSYAEYTHHDKLRQKIQQIVNEANSHLARFETIKKFELLPEPLLVETGELTPTMKVRRNIVEEKYEHLLNNMYTRPAKTSGFHRPVTPEYPIVR